MDTDALQCHGVTQGRPTSELHAARPSLRAIKRGAVSGRNLALRIPPPKHAFLRSITCDGEKNDRHILI
jgi:hypothetical protein